ncbi:MAG TPA: hypothetical protein VFK15_15220 [Burkholderiales bacterium]|nr:hypothetical protein [Burkholderiales bacterium]
MRQMNSSKTWRLIALGGLAGGTAEVLWVTLYAAATGVSATEVARQVTASLWAGAANWSLAPALGIAIHMALALALAAVCAPLLLRLARHAPPAAVTVLGVGALTLVWAVNFFLVLPALNPAFVGLMPYAATLVSKMLFGYAMATVVRRARVSRSRNPTRIR